MNRRLRQYLDKNGDLRGHNQVALDAIADRLNHRPRAVLGWRTPAELYLALVSSSLVQQMEQPGNASVGLSGAGPELCRE